MRRPFAVIGFTVFVTLFCLCALPEKTVYVLLPIAAAAAVVSLAVPRLRREPVLLSSLLAGAAACVLFLTAVHAQLRPIRALDGQTVEVSAHLADWPQQKDEQTVYTLRVDTIDGVPLRCRLTLVTDTPFDEVLPTDRLRFTAKLRASGSPENGGVRLRAYGCTDQFADPDKPTILSRTLLVRRYVTDCMTQTLPGTPGAVLTAMLLGESDHVPADVYANMQRSGIVHIFAVSGLHLSMFAMALLRLFTGSRVPRQIYVPLCMGLVLFVMAVTGFPLSSLRAGIMLILMLCGRLVVRRADALNSLGVSVLLLCMADPFCASDVGLQLSVLGTIGAVCGMPLTERLLAKLSVPFRLLCAALRSIVSAMLLSAIVTILTLPVTAMAFRSVSVVAPLANACMLFAARWAMIAAAVSVPFSLWKPITAVFRLLLLAAGILARYCVAVTDLFGRLPFAVLRIGNADAVVCMAGILLLAAAALLLRIPLRRKIAMTVVLSVLLMGVTGALQAYTSRSVVQICAPDAADGSAVLVKSGGQAALIGCGGSRTAYAVAEETDRLQLCLLPDTEKLRTDAALSVLRSVPTETIVLSGSENNAQTHAIRFFYNTKTLSDSAYQVGDVQIEVRLLPVSYAVRLQMYGKTMLLLFAPGCDVSCLPPDWRNADMLYVRADVPPGLQAEAYSLVLLQGEAEHIAEAARQIALRGGNAVCGKTILIQKDGYIGRRAGVCGAGIDRTGTQAAAAAKGVRIPVRALRRRGLPEVLLCRADRLPRGRQRFAGFQFSPL